LLVRTPQQLAERLEMGDSFLREITERGQVLYESPFRYPGEMATGDERRRTRCHQSDADGARFCASQVGIGRRRKHEQANKAAQEFIAMTRELIDLGRELVAQEGL